MALFQPTYTDNKTRSQGRDALPARGAQVSGGTNLNTFPIEPGSSKILKINPAGQIRTYATGLTTVLGLAFDSQARMYVLEASAAAGNPAPGNGRVARVNPNGSCLTGRALL